MAKTHYEYEIKYFITIFKTETSSSGLAKLLNLVRNIFWCE